MSRTDIESNNARFCAALGSRDMDGLMELYDPEITLLVPGSPPIRGHDGVREYYGNVFAAGVSGAAMSTLQLEELGEVVAEIGEYTMALDPPNGEAFEDTGKYLVIHRRRASGEWAMWLDMFHSDGPAS
jgi:ketosteroid isomerase-like protein